MQNCLNNVNAKICGCSLHVIVNIIIISEHVNVTIVLYEKIDYGLNHLDGPMYVCCFMSLGLFSHSRFISVQAGQFSFGNSNNIFFIIFIFTN